MSCCCWGCIKDKIRPPFPWSEALPVGWLPYGLRIGQARECWRCDSTYLWQMSSAHTFKGQSTQFPQIVFFFLFFFYEASYHTCLEQNQINCSAVRHSVKYQCIVVFTLCYGSHSSLGSAGRNDCIAYLGRLLCCCWNSTLRHTNLSHYYDKSNPSVRLADWLGLCSCFSWQTIIIKKKENLPGFHLHFRCITLLSPPYGHRYVECTSKDCYCLKSNWN